MDVRLHLEDCTRIFFSGDSIFGKINIFCAQKTIISELAATLIGESTSSLTGAPGLLFSRREEERHIIVQEEYQIVPTLRTSDLRLQAGCHSFDVRLRVPWVQDCSLCPPNTPVEDEYCYDLKFGNSTSIRQLPPSMTDLQKGNEITYRVDVVITTIRNMFKSRTVKSCPITIWPVDRYAGQHDCGPTSNAAITTARATVLGPNSIPLPLHVQVKEIPGQIPAEVLITAMFQPDFQLVKSSSTDKRSPQNRRVTMDLYIKKLNHHPNDLYLQSFQMLLVGYTDIRTGSATHGHMTFWTLQSLSNIGLQISSASDPSGTQYKIDSRLWNNVTLDDSVVPQFSTCNLERRYELEILMGWQCQSGEHVGRVFFVQARTPVRISSGILPSKDNEEIESTWCNNDLQTTANCKESRPLMDERPQRACARVSAPPAYDEAVRIAIYNGLKGFEMRNAGGW